MNMNMTTESRGEITARVFSADGKLKQEITKSNLLTNGRSSSGYFFTSITASSAYLNTGATNPRIEPDAGTTFTKVNNTVTRGGSTWDCSILRSGDQLKMADGSRIVVDTVVNDGEFTTDEVFFSPTTFAAQTGIVFLTRSSESSVVNGTTFGTQYGTADSVETIVSINNPETWSGQNEFEILFNPQGVAGTVNMFGVTNTCRVFLPTPLVLEATDFVRITYRVFINSNGNGPVQSFPDYNATGWPHTYNVSTMSSDGSNIAMTVDGDHHYEVGDTLLIQEATPTQIPIGNISSDGTTISVNSESHFFSVGQNMTILGTNNYDGNYTVTSVVDGDNFTITSALNVADETSGFVHDSTPANYYNQEFVVSSIPSANQIELTSTLNEPVTNNGRVSVPNTGFTFTDANTNANSAYHTRLFASIDTNFSGFSSTEIHDKSIPFTRTGQQEFTGSSLTNLTALSTINSIDQLSNNIGISFLATRDYGRIKQILFNLSFSSPSIGFYITFDHIQTKKDLYSLSLNVGIAHLQELV